MRELAFIAERVVLLLIAEQGVGLRRGGGERVAVGGQARSREEEVMPDGRPSLDQSRDSSQPVRVLLVEDDTVTLEFMSRLLADEGASVTEAASVRQVTEILQDKPTFDLLLTDYVLLDGTGVEVAKAARGCARRMVLVSGELGSVPLDEARAAGIEMFIPKFELTGRRVHALFAELFGEA